MVLVAITGGIGSGKTVVSKIFSIYGVPVYNSDVEAKRIMHSDQEVIEKMTALFGERAYVEKKLNRAFIADIVFRDRYKLESMNSIVHPAVCEDFVAWASRQNSEIAVIETALLIDSGLDKYVDKIVSVSSPLSMRVERAAKRDKVSDEAIRMRIGKQRREEEIGRISDYIVINDENSALLPQVESIIIDLKRH